MAAGSYGNEQGVPASFSVHQEFIPPLSNLTATTLVDYLQREINVLDSLMY